MVLKKTRELLLGNHYQILEFSSSLQIIPKKINYSLDNRDKLWKWLERIQPCLKKIQVEKVFHLYQAQNEFAKLKIVFKWHLHKNNRKNKKNV